MGLQMLGPKAAPAIPSLLQMATNSKTPDAAWSASAELGWIGLEALPALMTVVTNRQAPARGQAIVSMGAIRNLGTNANLVVPVLLKLVQDKDEDVAWSAIRSLGRIGAEPVKVVPTLSVCLGRPESSLRRNAAQALGSFRQDALLAVPQLIEAMTDKDLSVRDAVTNALREIAPEVLDKR
jgi:HEAT repeat protein